MIRETRFPLHVRSYEVGCDLCRNNSRTPEVAHSDSDLPLTVGPRTPDRFAYGVGECDAVPPITEESFLAELAKTGWRVENFHGKRLIICDSCRAEAGLP